MMRNALAACSFLVWAATASGTTVTFNVVSSLTSPQDPVTVAPGDTVDYVITVLVMPDDPADNTGFAAGGVDLTTDLGVAQSPVTELAEPLRFLTQLGTSEGDDVKAIFGAQNTISGGATLYGRGQAAEFARGTLQVPTTEGTYNIGVANGSANVLDINGVNSRAADEVLAGSGFQIVVAVVVPPPAAPAVQGPLTEGDTSVTVTGVVSGATQVKALVNGIQAGTAVPGGAGSVQVSVSALGAGQSVTATQTTAAGESAPSTAVVVQAKPTPPPPEPKGICGAGVGGYVTLAMVGLIGMHSGRRRMFR